MDRREAEVDKNAPHGGGARRATVSRESGFLQSSSMDNREAEANGVSPSMSTRNRRETRPSHNNRSNYNNWASNVRRRIPRDGAGTTHHAEEQQAASVNGTMNNGSSNLPIVVNDLLSSRMSNETANSNNLGGNRRGRGNHRHFGNNNNNNHNNNTNGSFTGPNASSANNTDASLVSRDPQGNTGGHSRLRRRHSNNTRAGGASRSNASTNTRAPTNTSHSPMRGTNPRTRVPPLRLRGHSPSQNPDPHQERIDRFAHLPLEDWEREFLALPSVFPQSSSYLEQLERRRQPDREGLGTDDDPIDLSPFDGYQEDAPSDLTDEEFARQLQQEEWERSATPAGEFNLTLNPLHHVYGRPSRRIGSNIPQAPRRAERGQTGHFPPESNLERRGGMRNPYVGRRFRIGPMGLEPRFHSSHQQHDEFMPFIFDMFQPEVLNLLHQDVQELPDDYESLLALVEELGEVSRGMSQANIDKLPTKKHMAETSPRGESGAEACGGDEKPQCNICLMDFMRGEDKRLLPCHHEFHQACVDQWLKTNASCPVCRKSLS